MIVSTFTGWVVSEALSRNRLEYWKAGKFKMALECDAQMAELDSAKLILNTIKAQPSDEEML